MINAALDIYTIIIPGIIKNLIDYATSLLCNEVILKAIIINNIG